MPNVFQGLNTRDPLNEAKTIGSNLGRFAGSLYGEYEKFQQEKKEESDKQIRNQKINEIIQEFNNPNSPEYAGMGESQRYLKVARLIYPYDQAMSQRFEEEANTIRQQKGKLESAEKVAETKKISTLGREEEISSRLAEKEASKKTEQENAKAMKDLALSEYNDAYDFWLENKESEVANQNLDKALNNAVLAGIKSLKDPRDLQLRKEGISVQKQQFATGQEYKKEESKKAEDIDLEKRAEKVMPIYGAYSRLKSNPSDISARSEALNVLLRKESGAAIGRDEVLSRINTMLPPEDYNNLINETGGLKGWLANTTGNENLLMIQTIRKYLPKMDLNKSLPILRDQIGSDRVFNYLESNRQQKSEPVKQYQTKRNIVKDSKSFFGK